MPINLENNKYLDLIFNEPYKIGHILGFNDLTELNNEWIKQFILNKQDMTLLAHRESYKTTCLSIAIALIMIVFPLKTIMFCRKTDDDVIEIIKQIQKIFNSDCIKYLVKKIYDIDFKLTEENSYKITTNLFNSTKGSSQLFATGIKSSLTGKHYDIVITDDIVNARDRVSKAERNLIKTQYMELQNIKMRDGRFINTGTKWHKEDCISLMPNVVIYDCYSTGLMTREQIEEKRSKMTSGLFSANYELKIVNDEDVLFKEPQFSNNNDKLYNGFAHIDASYGGEDGSVLTLANKDKETGKIYILGKRRQKHIDDCIDEFILIKNQYKCGSIDCEKNADKGYLAKEIRLKGEQANTYHEDMNKYIKISSILKACWQDIIFLEDTDSEYINEILEYNEQAEHDDSPDSCSSIIRRKFYMKKIKNDNLPNLWT